MRHAYDEMYVYDAQLLLASAFDYLKNYQNVSIDTLFTFLNMFNKLERLENGDPHLISGMSGEEFVLEAIPVLNPNIHYQFSLEKTREYWLGYYLAYYQWYTGKTYSSILNKISINEMLEMYPTYHEMDVMHFVDTLNEIINTKLGDTNLKKYRMLNNMSQSELAKVSGVSLRSIQLYEQRINDIDKAQGHTLYKLAKSLHVSIEKILENPNEK